MKPKSILHIITGLNVGGAERALHTLLTWRGQAACGHKVISLTDSGHYGPLLRSAGVPVACLDMTPGRPSPAAALRLQKMVREAGPDVVQGWMYHGNLAASLARLLSAPRAALSWNIRLSLEAGSQMKVSTRGAIRFGAWISSGPSAIIYNAVRSREQHERIGYASTHGTVMPNGFDTSYWRPDPSAHARLKQELGLPGNAILVGFVGRGDPQKDLPNLHSAFTIATGANPDVYLLCVGRGLRDLIGSVADPNRIRFLGQRNDVERLLPGFDFLCLSSSFEGFPNVIGEAMACGVPCVTTDVGDAAAIVAATGWIAPPRDSQALADALAKALAVSQEERQARGRAARKRIHDHFSLESVVYQYQALYTRLGEGR